MWRSIRSMCAVCLLRLPVECRNYNLKRRGSARWQSDPRGRSFSEEAEWFSLRTLLGCLSLKSQAAGEAGLAAARVGQVAAEQVAKAALEARAVQVERVARAEQAAKAAPEPRAGLAEARPGVLAAG